MSATRSFCNGSELQSNGPTEIQSLIGQIYDDVTQDPPWRRTLEHLRRLLTAQTTVLQVTVGSPHLKSYFFAAGVRTNSEHIAEWERWSRSEHIDLRLHAGGVRVFNDVTEMSGREGFLEMAHKYRVGCDISVGVLSTDDAEYEFHATRSTKAKTFGHADVGLIQSVVPHLARAIKFRSSLASARVIRELQGQALNRIGVGAILIDPNGAVTILNQAAQHILAEEDGLRLRSGILRADDPRCERKLSGTLKGITSRANSKDDHGPAVCAISITRPSGRRDFSVLLHQRGMLNPVSGRREQGILLFIRNPDARIVENAGIFCQLFNFTDMEARIAAQLANGVNFKEIQRSFQIKITTLRTHIQSMYEKTGVRRQPELIRILLTAGASFGSPFGEVDDMNVSDGLHDDTGHCR